MAPFPTVDLIEDLLPGLDVYLRYTLGAESLSIHADKHRKYFFNLIDFYRTTDATKTHKDGNSQSRHLDSPEEEPRSRLSLAEERSRDAEISFGDNRPNRFGRLPPPVLPKPVRIQHSRARTSDVISDVRTRDPRSSSPQPSRRHVSRDCRSISPLGYHGNKISPPPIAPKPVRCLNCGARNHGLHISVQDKQSQVAIETCDVTTCTGVIVQYDVITQTSQSYKACASTRTDYVHFSNDVIKDTGEVIVRRNDVTSTHVQTDLSFLGLEDMVDSLIEFNFDSRSPAVKESRSSEGPGQFSLDTLETGSQTDRRTFDEASSQTTEESHEASSSRVESLEASSQTEESRITISDSLTNIRSDVHQSSEISESDSQIPVLQIPEPEPCEWVVCESCDEKFSRTVGDLCTECETCLVLELTSGLQEDESDSDSDPPFQNILISPKLLSPVTSSRGHCDVIDDDADADEFGYQYIEYNENNNESVKINIRDNVYADMKLFSGEEDLPPKLPERPSFLKMNRPGNHGNCSSRSEESLLKSPVALAARKKSPVALATRKKSPVAMVTVTMDYDDDDDDEIPPPLPPRKVAPPAREGISLSPSLARTRQLPALPGPHPRSPMAPPCDGAPPPRFENDVITADSDVTAEKGTNTTLDKHKLKENKKQFIVNAKDESAGESDYTSYESYDDEGLTSDVSSRRHSHDALDDVTANVTDHDASVTSQRTPSRSPRRDRRRSPALTLPRLQSFRARRKLHPPQASQSASLPRDDVTAHRGIFGVSGELYHRGKLRRWTRRHCIIHDGKFVCYKSDRDSRPLLSFALANFDLAYVERDGKRNHVIRLSHPGYDTYLFSADSKQSADRWIQELSIASGQAPIDSQRWSNASNDSMSHDDSRDERLMSSNSLSSSLSQTSNHSDGDVTSTSQLATPQQSKVKLSPSSSRHSNYRRLSSPASQNVISRATPLRTEATPTSLEATPVETRRKNATSRSPDPNRLSAPASSKRRSMLFGSWGKRKRPSGSLELSTPTNLQVYEGANLAVTLSGTLNLRSSLGVADWAKRYCQPPDIFDQGRWLNVLIRETCMTQSPPDDSMPGYQDDSLGRHDISSSCHDNSAGRHDNSSSDAICFHSNPGILRSSSQVGGTITEELAGSLGSVRSSDSDGYEKQGLPLVTYPRCNQYYDFVGEPISLDDGYAMLRISSGSEKDHYSDSELVMVRPRVRDVYATVHKRKTRKASLKNDEKDVLSEAIARCFGEEALDSMPYLRRWHETSFHSDRIDIPCYQGNAIGECFHGDGNPMDSEDYYAEDVKPRYLPSRDDLDRRMSVDRDSVVVSGNVPSKLETPSKSDVTPSKRDLTRGTSLDATPKRHDVTPRRPRTDVIISDDLSGTSKKDSGIVEDTSEGSVQILVTDTEERTVDVTDDVIIGPSDVTGEVSEESDHDYEDVGVDNQDQENIYQEIDTVSLEEEAPPIPPRKQRYSSHTDVTSSLAPPPIMSYGSSRSLDGRPRSRSSPLESSYHGDSSYQGSDGCHGNDDYSSDQYRESTHASVSFSRSSVGDPASDSDDQNLYDPIDYPGDAGAVAMGDGGNHRDSGDYGDGEEIYETYSDHEQEILEKNRLMFGEQRELVKDQRRVVARLKKRRLAAENRMKFSRDPETRLKHSDELIKLNQEVTSLEFDLDLAERKMRSLAVMCRLEEGQGRRHRRSSSISSVQSNGW